MKKITLENYKANKYYPRIVRATNAILETGKVVAPVDVFVKMKLLDPKSLEDWRFGRIPYLERVIKTNLSRANLILRILRFHAHDLNLKPSHTAYVKWGKGGRPPLRFSKTGERNLEEAYSRHFVRLGGKKMSASIEGAQVRRPIEESDASGNSHTPSAN